MYASICLYVKCMQMISFWLLILCWKSSESVIYILLWASKALAKTGHQNQLCSSSKHWEWDQCRKRQKGTSLAGGTVGPWSWISQTSKPVSASPSATTYSRENSPCSTACMLPVCLITGGVVYFPWRWLCSAHWVPILFYTATKTKSPNVCDVHLQLGIQGWGADGVKNGAPHNCLVRISAEWYLGS